MLNLHKDIQDDLVRLLQNGNQTYYLLGDRGIGKRTVARNIASCLKAKLTEYDRFHIDDARIMKSTCSRIFEQNNLFLINGDQTTIPALQAILKLLEEPPQKCLVFICAKTVVLPTITSRCNMVIFPRLTDEELLNVLVFKGMNKSTAESLIKYAGGSVEGAYEAYRRQEQRKQYLRYFIALQQRDERFIFEQLRRITKDDVRELLEVCDSLLMSRYGFSEDSSTATPQFLEKVKSSFVNCTIPSIGLLRAWMKTAT